MTLIDAIAIILLCWLGLSAAFLAVAMLIEQVTQRWMPWLLPILIDGEQAHNDFLDSLEKRR